MGRFLGRGRAAGTREPVAAEPVAAREPVAAGEPVAGEPVVARERVAPARAGAPVAGPVRGRYGAAAAAHALARIVQLIVAAVVGIILLAIALVVLDANASNSIVSTVHDAGKALVGPFKDVFSDKDPKIAIAENWGLAAIVYLVIGTFIANLIARVGEAREVT